MAKFRGTMLAHIILPCFCRICILIIIERLDVFCACKILAYFFWAWYSKVVLGGFLKRTCHSGRPLAFEILSKKRAASRQAQTREWRVCKAAKALSFTDWGTPCPITADPSRECHTLVAARDISRQFARGYETKGLKCLAASLPTRGQMLAGQSGAGARKPMPGGTPTPSPPAAGGPTSSPSVPPS